MILFIGFLVSNRIKIEKQVKYLFYIAFGYGKQNDLDIGKHPHNVNPSPDTYNLNTFV